MGKSMAENQYNAARDSLNDGAPYPLPTRLEITIVVVLFLVSFAMTGAVLYALIMLFRRLAGG